MARYLVTYFAGDMAGDPASVADARRAFTRWAEQVGAALAEVGAPVRSAVMIAADGVPAPAAGDSFMGWSVLEAADSAAAVRLVQDHPFISRGGRVQLSEPV
jgi:hypothetical protein